MNGLLLVNKPGGLTSHDVVSRVRKITHEQSVGHLGTLDPMATGVLPLLLGRFTRLAQFFRGDDKAYSGVIRFGVATDTYDAMGVPVGDACQPALTLDVIRSAACCFHGEIEQMPPPFSAKKIAGTPAYKLARQGKPVELRAARITVARLEIAEYAAPDATFAIEISSGGYIRSIAHDLGQRLGCGAHLASLCRTRAGCFALEDTLTLEQIAALAEQGSLQGAMPHPRALLPEIPNVTVDARTAANLRNGMSCNLPDFSGSSHVKIFTGPDELFAIGRRIAGTLIQPCAVLG